ncbi:MAG: hypothetical protein WCF14_08575 [Nitrososphaeraceae archaeon]
MSSKKPKSDDKDKQQREEVEINAELAPNEETTKEVETIEGVSAPTIQEQEQEAIETALDKTKKSIKKTHSKIS